MSTTQAKPAKAAALPLAVVAVSVPTRPAWNASPPDVWSASGAILERLGEMPGRLERRSRR